MEHNSKQQHIIDRQRYLTVRSFFLRVFLNLWFWDIICDRPVLKRFRPDPLSRWIMFARQFRNLALKMGGVLIKLGQFLSARVDILPIEVTRELANLQDEVPPEKTERIIAQIEEDFDQPIFRIFPWFSPEPLGAASLAQVHQARTRAGTPVVVKVRRPGIEVLVETDLKAVAQALSWLKLFKPISSRVNLDMIAEEFATVTRHEIDFRREARNLEQLAADFNWCDKVYFPKLFKEYCQARTLTMEHVGFIKITETEAIKAVGVNPTEVADTLYQVYMKQVFETSFVHVDPHPGNLFVKPLPTPAEIENGITDFTPHDKIPYQTDRSFQIAFIDFGMTAVIPRRLRSAIREYAIAIGTHDAWKLVQSLKNAGILLNGADLIRLEEAHEILFNQFWGVSLSDFKHVAFREAEAFFQEYRDLIYEMPIQFPTDMLFVMRAIGILAGLAVTLDPDFNIWEKTTPFAKRFAKEEFKQEKQAILNNIETLTWQTAQLPLRLDQLLSQLSQGKLTIRSALSPDTRTEIRKLRKAIEKLAWFVLCGFMLLIGTNLYHKSGWITFCAAGFALWSFWKGLKI